MMNKPPKSKPINLLPETIAQDVILAAILHRLDKNGVWAAKDSKQYLYDLIKVLTKGRVRRGVLVVQDVLLALEELGHVERAKKQN